MTDIPLNTRIEWTNEDRERGKCPVPAGSNVTVWFEDEDVVRLRYPQNWNWREEAAPKITAYKVHSVPQQPRAGMKHYPTVTRVEVIDQSGRAYIVTDAKGVKLDLQDLGNTLKVFIEGEKK